MFVRSETDKRRILIIDVMHLFYRYAFGGAPQLSTTLRVDGVPKVVDTTLPTYTIKQIHRWSRGGIDPVIVCFDSKGSTRCRRAYFIQNNMMEASTDYKGGREKQSGTFYEGINTTYDLLSRGGVCCLKGENYEADDLIKAAVDRAKIEFPDLPIDIITGDMDLVPLVDDQVSVFLMSRKITRAEEPAIEKKNYVQLTPSYFQEYLEGVTDFKNLVCPYNTVLLKKLLRGDKSDKVPQYPKFTPTLYKKLIEALQTDGIDLGTFCRYDAPTATVCYRGTEEPIPLDKIDEVPKEQKMVKYGDPPCLTRMLDVLKDYVDQPLLDHIRRVYLGINLNGAYTGLPEGFNRQPASMKKGIIKGYSYADLQSVVSLVRINLPMV